MPFGLPLPLRSAVRRCREFRVGISNRWRNGTRPQRTATPPGSISDAPPVEQPPPDPVGDDRIPCSEGQNVFGDTSPLVQDSYSSRHTPLPIVSPEGADALAHGDAMPHSASEEETLDSIALPFVVIGLPSLPVDPRHDEMHSSQIPTSEDRVLPSQPSRHVVIGHGASYSRTLIIYVVEPHSHSLFLAHGLDSLEALRRLSELFASAESPTASKEDIEKSGLEVFQASSIQEYESSGRVASNCTEKCLICLEDYISDEKLRVLTCRHAFHQVCVDTWLHTGKNNCPACRSQGVEIVDSRRPRFSKT